MFMIHNQVLLLLLITLTNEAICCSFIAAVYQHAYQDYGIDPLVVMNSNLDIYEKQVANAASKNAQIIVFPEDGITGLNWDSTQNLFYQQIMTVNETSWNPCQQSIDSNETLVPYRLSCMAKHYSIIVVANFPTQVYDDSGTRFNYSTDAAFGVDGHLLAHYYKINLYGEPFDTPPDNLGYFDTSFGRFGMLTCFDLLWAKPTLQLVQQLHVDTLLFPTAWMDQLPYLTSIQAQSAWSFGLNVNLLAANLFYPIGGFMGSGMYAGHHGPIIYNYDNNETNGTLLVTQLPCSSNSQSTIQQLTSTETHMVDETFHFIKHENMNDFVGVALPTEGEEGSAYICQGRVCCNATFKYDAQILNGNESYWLVVHQGNISERDLYTYSAEVCSLLWCVNGILSLNTCAVGPSSKAVPLSYLTLSANFTVPYIFPSVLASNLQLRNDWYYESSMENDQFYSTLAFNSSEAILAATLYARRYNLDP